MGRSTLNNSELRQVSGVQFIAATTLSKQTVVKVVVAASVGIEVVAYEVAPCGYLSEDPTAFELVVAAIKPISFWLNGTQESKTSGYRVGLSVTPH